MSFGNPRCVRKTIVYWCRFEVFCLRIALYIFSLHLEISKTVKTCWKCLLDIKCFCFLFSATFVSTNIWLLNARDSHRIGCSYLPCEKVVSIVQYKRNLKWLGSFKQSCTAKHFMKVGWILLELFLVHVWSNRTQS